MTTLVAVMNREAMAVAADSALSGTKIFTSTDKIHPIKENHPVAIMYCGSSEIIGIQWEAWINKFSDNLKGALYNNLIDYSTEFFKFMGKNSTLFTNDEEISYCSTKIYNYYQKMKDEIGKPMKSMHRRKFMASDLPLSDIFKRVEKDIINDHHGLFQSTRGTNTLDFKTLKAVKNKYRPIINKLIKDIFPESYVDTKLKGKLREIGLNLIIYIYPEETIYCEGETRLIFVGYGKNDMFPSYVEWRIDGFINGKLKIELGENYKLSSSKTASITPFAQSSVVFTFVTGIDPEYTITLKERFSQMREELLGLKFDDIKGINKTIAKSIHEKIDMLSDRLIDETASAIEELRIKNHTQSILNVVRMLPKEELANMAESLINITALKLRISDQAETVGGPVDVAVISKSDGFKWIKKKSYFPAELNK